jgi:nitrogen fixation NifU-like protein
MNVFSSFGEKAVNLIKEPNNVGIIKDADGIGYINEPSRGIDLELYIKVEHDIICDAKFKAFGCGATIASCSVVTELIKGLDVFKAAQISRQTITEALGGLPPSKTYCAVLGELLLKSSIEDYLAKNKKE